MGTPTEANCAPPPDQGSEGVRSREQAEGYVAMICFKHGPPRLHGVELEWTVHDRRDPRLPLDLGRLGLALGAHAPATINGWTSQSSRTSFRQEQLPLPAGSVITVEPGGQVEISTPPTRSVAELITMATADTAVLTELLDQCGLVLGHQGTDPHRPPRRLLQVPRYQAMQAAFDLIGPAGSQMMCSTASTQVCLDAGEANQCATRWRAANSLGPTLVALFANSPNLDGRHTGWASSRLKATLATCPPFSLPPEPCDDPAAQWARTAMQAPVICVRGDGASWAAPPGLTFSAWIADPFLVGRRPTFDDLDYHLSTLFPPVRPKGYLEIRYLDAQEGSRWVTPFVLLAALMARQSTVDQVLAVTAPSERRWVQAARDGLADRVLGAAAHKVVRLGADCLDHLDLTTEQRTHVLDDLALRVESIPASQRCSA